ncbi:hypothetical protein SGRIM128S_09732 [Streptomyces griseomycini]
MDAAQPLPQRVFRDQRARLIGYHVVFTEFQPELGEVLLCGEPLFVQSGDGGLDEDGVPEVGERRAPPQPQRLRQQRRPRPGSPSRRARAVSRAKRPESTASSGTRSA